MLVDSKSYYSISTTRSIWALSRALGFSHLLPYFTVLCCAYQLIAHPHPEDGGSYNIIFYLSI